VIILIGAATANAAGDRRADGEMIPAVTTLPAEEVQRFQETYEIWIAILDDSAVVDGNLYENAALENARVALDGRCETDGPGEAVAPMPATDAGGTANVVLAAIDCHVTTMSVTIESDGQASGVIGVSDPNYVDSIQNAVGPGVQVVLDLDERSK